MVHQHHYNRQRAVFAMPIPSSNSDRIIFPFDKPNKKFNTKDYSSIQTQDQFTTEEIENFLQQVANPVLDWQEKYGPLFDGSTKLCCVLVICFILMPLLFVFACWLSYAQNSALRKHAKMTESIRIWVRDNQQQFKEKGFMWNIPPDFPLWIELWTNFGGSQPFLSGFSEVAFARFQQLGIQMTSMSQQNYLNQEAETIYGGNFEHTFMNKL